MISLQELGSKILAFPGISGFLIMVSLLQVLKKVGFFVV